MAILTHPSALDASVEQLAEVGPKTARLLEKLGIRTVRDLLVTLPFGWESFVESPISELVPGAQASVVGTILSIKPLTTQRRRMRLVEATVTDDSGAQMRVVWFHSEFVLRQLHAGDRVALAGVVELQAAFALMRNAIAAEPALPIPYRQQVIDQFKAGLGFELTHAQRRATWEAF